MTSVEEAEGVSMKMRSSYALAATAAQGPEVTVPTITFAPLSSTVL